MIALGCDHAGFPLKEEIKQYLDSQNIAYHDYGCYSPERFNYAVSAQKACDAVVKGECSKALLFCGTGIGISLAANKVHGIRCAVCSDCFSAEMSRRHNNANIIALGGRVVGPGLALMLVDLFLDTPFEGGRHQRRVSMIEE